MRRQPFALKRAIGSLLLAGGLLLGLVGCTAAPPPSTPASGASSIPPQPEPEPLVWETLKDRLAFPYAGSQSSCYTLLPHADGSADVLAIDYNTLQLGPEESFPPGDDTGLQGILPLAGAGAAPVVFDGELFIFQYGLLAPVQLALRRAVVYHLQPGGIRELSLPDGHVFDPQSAVLYGDGAFHFSTLTQTDTGAAASHLVSLNPQSGKAQVVHSFAAGATYTLQGGYAWGYLLQCASDTGFAEAPRETEAPEPDSTSQADGAESPPQAAQTQLAALNVLSGKLLPLAGTHGGTALARRGRIYRWDTTRSTLTARQPGSDTETTVLHHLTPPQGYRFAGLEPLWGNIVLIHFTHPDNATLPPLSYWANLATGVVEQAPSPLPPILAQGPDIFLIQVGEKQATRPEAEPAGEYLHRTTVPVYGIIGQHHYWAGQTEAWAPVGDSVFT